MEYEAKPSETLAFTWKDLGFSTYISVFEYHLTFTCYEAKDENTFATEVYTTGSVKWDGCCDVQEGPSHFCTKEDIENYGNLLLRIYELRSKIPHWSGD